MKTHIYITLIALFYSLASCAQTKFKEGIITGKKDRFEVKKSAMVLNNQQPWFIFPQKNKYKGSIPSPKDNYQFHVLKSDIHVDLNQVNNIVYQVLNSKRQALHDKKETLGIIFVFETDGTVANVSYSLLENTLITPADIENIDNELRSNLKASFTGIDYKHYVAVDYSFSRVKF